MDSVHHIWCPLSSQEYQDLPDGAETTLTPGETVPENDPDGIVMPDDMRLAILFLITHFYENRSTVSEVDMAEMPLSFKWLVGPYRFYPQ